MENREPDQNTLAEATYVSLRTFRKNGSSADTPIWVARLDGSLVMFTEGESWKAKRIRANPRCAVAVCNAFGTVSSGWAEGTARIVEDPERERRAYEALRAKYGWQMRLVDLVSWIGGRIAGRVILEVSLPRTGGSV